MRAAETDKALIQDRFSKLEIIGLDVDALYPSLEAIQVANIVYQAVMESKIKFRGVNYQEATSQEQVQQAQRLVTKSSRSSQMSS